MGLSSKNLISLIKAELIADNDVLSILPEGEDGVKLGYNENYSDLDATQKPFINIIPVGREVVTRGSNRRKFNNTMRVEYIEAIHIADLETDFLDRVEYVQSVIYNAALDETAFDTSRAYQLEDVNLEYIFTDKFNTAIFTLTYGYYETIT